MPAFSAYSIRTPQVVHETVDGEVVAIDFTTGSYFSMQGAAEAAWTAVAAGSPTDGVIAAVGARYADDDLEARVVAFLDQLVDEGLLVRGDAEPGSAATEPAATNGAARPPLEGLGFEKFTDMEQIILLDPVHDVSQAGWPSTGS